ESCTMTRETGTMTRSPAFASRAATRDRIFSATVLGNDPLTKQRVELIHRQRAGVGQGLDPPRDLAQLVLAEFEAKLLRAIADRPRVVGVHPRDETAEWRDPIALADPEHARVDVGRPAFEDGVAVGDGAPGVVVAVELDVAVHVVPELDGERVALARRRDANGVRHADAVHAHSVDRRVDLEEVALRGTEAVLAREADLFAVIADK